MATTASMKRVGGWGGKGTRGRQRRGCGAAGKGDGRLGAVWVWQRPTNRQRAAVRVTEPVGRGTQRLIAEEAARCREGDSAIDYLSPGAGVGINRMPISIYQPTALSLLVFLDCRLFSRPTRSAAPSPSTPILLLSPH